MVPPPNAGYRVVPMSSFSTSSTTLMVASRTDVTSSPDPFVRDTSTSRIE
jgi:hypothetical protein